MMWAGTPYEHALNSGDLRGILQARNRGQNRNDEMMGMDVRKNTKENGKRKAPVGWTRCLLLISAASVRNRSEQFRVHQRLELLVAGLEVNTQVRAIGVDRGVVHSDLLGRRGAHFLVQNPSLDQR